MIDDDPLVKPAPRPTWRDLLSMSLPELGLRADDGAGFYFVDIDRFKAVNDVLGYDAGDQLLQEFTRRIDRWAGPRGLTTEVDGDVIAVLRPGLADQPRAQAEGERLRELLREPVTLAGREVSRSVSIGLAFLPPGELSISELAKCADDALEAAQQRSGNVAVGFSGDVRSWATYRSQIELNLRAALRTEALHMHFQPEVDMRTGALVGVEALMRWRHPVLGLLGADQFVEVAERTEMIVELGEWALREACRHRKSWAGLLAGRSLVVRVNMSPTQLADAGTPALVADVLAEFDLAPEVLCIEMTESEHVPDLEGTSSVMRQLRASGVTTALDDYGTGFSSLLRLKALPIDAVKIDRSFVGDLGTDPTDTIIVAAIISIAGDFGLEIVAEGVETRVAALELLRLGCHRAQGHLFGQPVPPDELRPLLEAGRVPVEPPLG